VVLHRHRTSINGPVGCAEGTWIFNLTGAQDGLYIGQIRVTKNGRVSPAVEQRYTLDTTAPLPPTVSNPPSPSNVRTPSYQLSGETGATWSCTLTGPGAGTIQGCGPGTLTLSLPATQGTYTLSVTTTDAALNSSTTTRTYVLDLTPPAAPVVTGGATGPSRDRAPSYGLSDDGDGVRSCTLTTPGGVTTSVTCTAPTLTLNLSGADGTYTLAVTMTDAAGNAATTTRTHQLDTTRPADPGVTGPPGPLNSRTPSFAFVVEAGASVVCTLRNPAGVDSVVTCGPTGATLSLGGADGVYRLTVVATDAAGNASNPTSVLYELDTTAPNAPGVGGSGGPSNSRNPVFTLTGEAGGVWTCRLTAADGTTTTTIGCAAGPLQLSLPAVDGTYTLVVTQRDAAGNTSSETTRTYVLDTVPPPAPTVTGPAGPASGRSPVFTLSGGSHSWTCTLTSPSGVQTTLTCAAGALELDLTGGSDGTWTLRVTTTSQAGNTSAVTARTYLLDTTGPLAPGVTGPAGPSNVRNPGFTLVGETGATFSCTLTGPAAGATAQTIACAAGSLVLDLTGIDGTYTLAVTTRDVAGNPGGTTTRAYLLDTTAPVAPGIAGPRGPSNVRNPGYVLSGEAGASYACTLTGPAAGATATSLACGAGSLTLSLGGVDGDYVLVVTTTDAAGNSSSTSLTYVLDTTAPAAPGLTGPAGPSNSRAPAFTLTGEAGGTYTCTLTDPNGVTTSVSCAAGTLTLSTPGDDGVWVLVVSVTDAAGNTSATTTRTYRLDTTPPAAPGVSGPAGPLNSRSPSFTFTVEPGASVSCTLTNPTGGVSAVACTTAGVTLSLAGDDGTWTLTVRATDAAGNVGNPTSVGYVLDTTPPAAPG
jgi:hypothetical protein